MVLQLSVEAYRMLCVTLCNKLMYATLFDKQVLYNMAKQKQVLAYAPFCID